MRVCAVILDNTTKAFDKVYNYAVPDEMEHLLETGVRVKVPFGRGSNTRVAYFLDFIEEKEQKYKLKSIIDVLDEKSVLSKNMFRLAKKMRYKYFCTYSKVLSIMIPYGMKIKKEKYVKINEKLVKINKYKNEVGEEKFNYQVNNNIIKIIEKDLRVANQKKALHVKLDIDHVLVNDILDSGELNNQKQIKLLEILMDFEDISISDCNNYENISRSTIKTLEKKGYIQIFEKQIIRQSDKDIEYIKDSKKMLTLEQKNAMDCLEYSLELNDFDKYLLHGVTGSGKTEIYLQIVEKVINKGKEAIMLIPEISLTPMMIKRFKCRFGNDVAILHSRLSIGQKYDEWNKIQNGEVHIAIGARSCIFAPFNNLGIIIIDEEHETSYKSDTTPKYDAREVAKTRCELESAILLLGSATPDVKTYHEYSKDNKIIELKDRINDNPLPKVEIVDMKEELHPTTTIFSQTLIDEININLKRKEQTLLFLNRRGFSNMFLCQDCGEALKCPNCDISLKYHKKHNILVCHYCSYFKKAYKKCDSCGSNNIIDYGIGTQKVEEEVKRVFKEASVMRMDLDTTGYKNSHMELLDKFENEKIDILIGTQMIAKGHDFENITLVGILAADTLTKGNSIYAQERAYQLIAQTVGRSGRGDKKGRAIIQAFDVDAHSLHFGAKQDYTDFYNYETKLRRNLLYPPFSIMGKIIISGENSSSAEQFASIAYKMLETSDLEVSSYMKAPVFKIKNMYRYHIILKGDSEEYFYKVTNWFYSLLSNKLPNTVHCSIDLF